MQYSAWQVARQMRDHTFKHTGLWQDESNEDIRYSMRWITGAGADAVYEVDRIAYMPMTEGRIGEILYRIDAAIECYAEVDGPSPFHVRISKQSARKLVKEAAGEALHIYIEDPGVEGNILVRVEDSGWETVDKAIEF